MQDYLQELVASIIGGRKPVSSSIAISFVNNSLSDGAFSSPCARFAVNMETTDYGEAYRAMNAGYKVLSDIAYPVKTKEEAFELIGQAFGSVERFFDTLESQRFALKLYAHSLIEKGGYSWLEGSFLLAVCAQAKEWGRKFKLEYHETRKNVSIAEDLGN